MSNQVYSNRYGAGNSYLPRMSDAFTLIKNVPAAPPRVAYGTASKNSVNNTGVGLFFNRLNGHDVTIVGDITNYAVYQSLDTKQYWTLSANSTILSGTTLLYSLVDNVIAVSATIPIRITSGSGNIPFKICIKVMNADNSVALVHGLNGRDVPAQTANPIQFCCTGTVQIKAGQKLGIFVYATGQNITIQDDLNETDNIVFPCSLEFTKM